MRRWLVGLFCVLLSGAALAAGPSALYKQAQASMLLTGTIVVAPDGSVRSYAIDRAEKLPPEVTGLIASNIPQWKFEPTLLAGKPVAAEAKMSLRVVAKPMGDGNYSLSIRGTHFGQDMPGEVISYKKRVQPVYPRQAVQDRASGTVYLLVRVGRQGQVEDAVAQQVNMAVLDSSHQVERGRQALAKAALQAAWQWTFNPPTSGKDVNADYWVASVPVNFSLGYAGEARVDKYGQWEVYVPGPRQPVPWFDRKGQLSSSVDALPPGGLYQLDRGPQLTTPLDGA
jgi:TonB family protein